MTAAGSVLDGKGVLMVFAHCDDELVCGWPVLQNPAIKKRLLIASSDRNNAARKWCSHRKYVTLDLCNSLGIEARVLDYDSEFYRLDHRSGKLAKAEDEILKAIDDFSFDYVLTHNPHGEYGHLDHKFLFNLLLRAARWPLLITDISLRADWTRVEPSSPQYAATFYRNRIGTVELDESCYRKVMRYYETRGVWTWSQEPSRVAGLYSL